MQIMRARPAVRKTPWTVVVVEAVQLGQDQGETWYRAVGHVKPIAIVIGGPDGAYACDVGAKRLDLDELYDTVPGLDVLIARGTRRVVL